MFMYSMVPSVLWLVVVFVVVAVVVLVAVVVVVVVTALVVAVVVVVVVVVAVVVLIVVVVEVVSSSSASTDRGEFLPEIGIGAGIACNANLFAILLPVLSQAALCHSFLYPSLRARCLIGKYAVPALRFFQWFAFVSAAAPKV